jgi:crotonobetainyl-CoA:carnitine CoA-transferase CaiB-like acyl-CoA transferase
MQPFKNISVLDLSQGIAGPVCAGILARQGARVVKVEPLTGDWIRATGGSREGMCANAIAGNLNKQGIAIDATKPAGRDALLRLADQADVVVENFRAGVMARLGLGYEAIRARNPRVVYCSITGFGPSGPLSKKPATDSVLQAYSGMAVANAMPGGIPKRIGLYVPDNISAIYAAQAISAALFERCSSSQGRHVEVSLAECCAAFQSGPMIDTFLYPDPASRAAIFAPAGEFRTSDGWIVVSCMSVKREEWLADARFVENDARKQHMKEINAALAEALTHDTTANWVKKLEAADVLVSPVNDYLALRDDEQTQHSGYLATVDQAPYGALNVPNLPAADRNVRPAPRVGEHTRAVLRDAGFADADIDALIAQGIALQREA